MEGLEKFREVPNKKSQSELQTHLRVSCAKKTGISLFRKIPAPYKTFIP